MPNEFITSETKSLLRFIDANGNEVIVYPITRAELIAGLTEWSESEGNTPNWANVLGKPEVLDGKDGAT